MNEQRIKTVRIRRHNRFTFLETVLKPSYLNYRVTLTQNSASEEVCRVVSDAHTGCVLEGVNDGDVRY